MDYYCVFGKIPTLFSGRLSTRDYDATTPGVNFIPIIDQLLKMAKFGARYPTSTYPTFDLSIDKIADAKAPERFTNGVSLVRSMATILAA